MKVLDESERRVGLARQVCIVATLLLSVACAGYPTREANQPGASVGKGISDVHVELRKGSLYVNYRTRISIRDCDGHRAEMPVVWKSHVKERLDDPELRDVVLFPEDQSGLSVTIEFRKDASGEWSASGPCAVRLPVR